MPQKRIDTWEFTVSSDIEGDEPRIVQMRGTHSPLVARQRMEQITEAQRQKVVRDWGEEHAPTFKIDGPRAVADNTALPPGGFRPQGAKTIDLARYTKSVSEKLGHGGERPEPQNSAAALRAADRSTKK